jgi:hypothetical protein
MTQQLRSRVQEIISQVRTGGDPSLQNAEPRTGSFFRRKPRNPAKQK